MRGYFDEGRHVATRAFWRMLVASACVTAFATAACHRLHRSDRSTVSEPRISIHEEITPQPVRVGDATVAVALTDATAKPVTRAAIMVEADMAHPGMAPVFAAANEISPGSYRAKINFNMGGDWVLLLHITLADGGKVERQMDVRGVRSN